MCVCTHVRNYMSLRRKVWVSVGMAVLFAHWKIMSTLSANI